VVFPCASPNRNYFAELTGHEETGVTDVNGQVHFEAKTLRASPLKRFVAVIHSAMGGVHASFGPHAFVFAFGHEMEGDWVDNQVTLATGQDRHRL
jgi:hypothetical protein